MQKRGRRGLHRICAVTTVLALGLVACDDAPSVGAEGLTREIVVEFLHDQVEASENQDVDQLAEYMAESIYIRHTATFGGPLATEVMECTGREECIAMLEDGNVPISDYEITVSDVEVSIAPDRLSATVHYTQQDSGVIDGTEFRAEARATDEYEVQGRDLVITRSEAASQIAIDSP